MPPIAIVQLVHFYYCDKMARIWIWANPVILGGLGQENLYIDGEELLNVGWGDV